MKGLWNDKLNKYLQSTKPGFRERAGNWKMLIGLLRVDGLFISNSFARILDRHVRGTLSTGDVAIELGKYYARPSSRELGRTLRTGEADWAVQRAAAILRDPSFSVTATGLGHVHAALYDGIYRCAGKIRDCGIDFAEWVLGWTHVAIPCEGVKEQLNAAMAAERAARLQYTKMDPAAKIRHLAQFLAAVWKPRPFRQRNTFALAVFALKHFAKLGFTPDPAVFAEHAWYFRNALVRATFDDPARGIAATTEYLERFLANLLLGEKNELRDADLRVPGPSGELACEPGDFAVAATLRLKPDIQRIMMLVEGEISIGDLRKALGVKGGARSFTNWSMRPLQAGGLVETLKPVSRRDSYHYRLGPLGLAWRYGTGYAWHPVSKEK